MHTRLPEQRVTFVLEQNENSDFHGEKEKDVYKKMGSFSTVATEKYNLHWKTKPKNPTPPYIRSQELVHQTTLTNQYYPHLQAKKCFFLCSFHLQKFTKDITRSALTKFAIIWNSNKNWKLSCTKWTEALKWCTHYFYYISRKDSLCAANCGCMARRFGLDYNPSSWSKPVRGN